MGSMERRAKDRWRARYRGPDGRQRSRTFSTERAAKAFLAQTMVDLRDGSWVDPRLATVTVAEWGRKWLDRKALDVAATTSDDYRSLLETCVLPTWGPVRLGDVTWGGVDAWIAMLRTPTHQGGRGLASSRVRKAHGVLAQILGYAVKDGRLRSNPALGVSLPRPVRSERRSLTMGQVVGLLDACDRLHESRVAARAGRPDMTAPVNYKPLVAVLAFCGLRFGEAAALRVSDVNPMQKRIRVSQSVTETSQGLVEGLTKTHQARSVGLPKHVAEMVVEHMAGRQATDLLFPSPEGTHLRNGNFRRREWNPLLAEAGIDGLVPHELRHTAASLAIESGASIKEVQNMLGHRSATLTLDVYGHLFDGGIDAVAERLGNAFLAAHVASMCPEPPQTVIPMRTAEG